MEQLNEEGLELLRTMFGAAVEEATTQRVLLAPTQAQAADALRILTTMPLELLMKQLGGLAAAQVAQGIQVAGLRPADFAGFAEFPEAMAKRLAKALSDGSDQFREAFIRRLGMQG